MKKTIQCTYCGKELIRSPSHIHATNFCNKGCQGRWQSEHPELSNLQYRESRKIPVICDYCGKEIWIFPSRKRHRFHFCNRQCKDAGQSIYVSGANNGRWKGGRRTNGKYILCYAPNHPRAHQNCVYEHILIAEEKYGRPITRAEHVHHLNGIKTDNRPENLVVVAPKDHDTYSVRHALQERIRELEEELTTLRHSGS